jgi:hypothetical protein
VRSSWPVLVAVPVATELGRPGRSSGCPRPRSRVPAKPLCFDRPRWGTPSRCDYTVGSVFRQPSGEPLVLFKLALLGCLHNLGSEGQLCEEAGLTLA